ncbi:uncharacterized protein PHACADRAFT_246056 [Phanerochaete carnosa HHB-10118-sp]|uniref:Uncharacterized protein n=1 Tax=Phanerochaete carnosa (strain HHB-10118-sp) TaxID=650164 RepID=K5VBC4_PHACS|nr:uncharacterized protein PHACADRAFT_246056 [Phanerochaete carnosa HHB-10118-sp]EKM60201.1 hypothetical protein PHACADRAFT_246056 [Phanerochaete carnosa HHB-10118-sp]
MGAVLISVVSALRMYALWKGSRMKYVFPAIVLTLGMLPAGLNIFIWVLTSFIFMSSESPPLVECLEFTNMAPTQLGSIWVPTLISSSIVASACDIVVLALTWIKSFAHWREMRRLKLTSSISTVLLRDAPSALLSLSALQPLTGFVSYVFCFAPLLLVQRFILNLRQLGHAAEASENNSDAQRFSRFSVSFRVPSDFLGNIGETLDHGQSEQVEEDNDESHCVAQEPRDGLEEDLAHQAGPSMTRREKLTGADVARILRLIERADEEQNVGLSTFPCGTVTGLSMAAD